MKKPIKKTLLRMNALVVVMIAFTFAMSAQKLTINLVNAPLKSLLSEITAQTDYTFVYSNSFEEVAEKVTISVRNEELSTVLKSAFAGTAIVYRMEGKQILLSTKEIEQKNKDVTIKGTITDSKGDPLVGVYVINTRNNKGVSSDLDGKYSIVASQGDVLSFSSIGLESYTATVGSGNTLNVVMKEDIVALNDVVVVGYGTSSIKDLTGSVSSVGVAQLSQLNTPNVSSMLQNMAAGVQVSQNTGVPGEVVRVRVRGATSLTGSNEPLYVIDGVPVDDPSMLDVISPSDIQSMDVLKDASAAAIYGSRAANGVVIITTKRGQEGAKPIVSFNYNMTTDVQVQNFRILYGDEWRETVRKFAESTLVYDPSNSYAKEILAPGSQALGTANTNWFREVAQPAIRHNGDLSISGGGKMSKYIIALSVFDQAGMIKGSDMTRYNARVSTEVNVLPILRFGVNANMSYTDQNTAGTTLFNAQGYRPDFPVYNERGEFELSNGSPNPVANTFIKDNSDIYRAMGTIYGEVDIIKDLKFRSSLSGNVQFTTNESFSPSFLNTRKYASGDENHYRYFKTVFDNTLSYNHAFNENHVIDAVVGVSFERGIGESTYIAGQTYPDDEIYTDISCAASITRWSTDYNASGLFSSFARLNYKLMDRYLFTFTGRYDGSSMFGSNNRYGFFPSGAFAWRISNEEFMKNVDFVNDLKLRASAGTTGSQNLTSFSNRDLYSAATYNSGVAIIHGQIGNRDIRWEKSTQYDLGLDFSLFNHRLTGSVTGYVKNTNDLIWSFSFPQSATGSAMTMNRNVGALKNSGVEVYMVGRVLSTDDWGLDISLNMSHNNNRVTKLVEEGAAQTAMDVVVQGSSNQVLAVGYPMGAFLGYEYNGIIQDQARVDALNAYAKEKGQSYYDTNALKPGNVEIKDANEDGIINTKDRVIIGSPDPDLFGGITANLTYKRFSLFANFGYQIGGTKIYSKAVQNLPGQLTGLIAFGLDDRWSDNNKDAKYPAMYIGEGVPKFTKMDLFDASFFRLQELRLTYNLPFKKVVKGQVFVAATNLFTITSYPGTDPATVNTYNNYGGNYDTSTYPGFRSFSLGLKINL